MASYILEQNYEESGSPNKWVFFKTYDSFHDALKEATDIRDLGGVNCRIRKGTRIWTVPQNLELLFQTKVMKQFAPRER